MTRAEHNECVKDAINRLLHESVDNDIEFDDLMDDVVDEINELFENDFYKYER